MQALEELIAGAPVFAGLEARHLGLIAGCGRNEHVDTGRLLVREGEAADTFYLIHHKFRGSASTHAVGPSEAVELARALEQAASGRSSSTRSRGAPSTQVRDSPRNSRRSSLGWHRWSRTKRVQLAVDTFGRAIRVTASETLTLGRLGVIDRPGRHQFLLVALRLQHARSAPP